MFNKSDPDLTEVIHQNIQKIIVIESNNVSHKIVDISILIYKLIRAFVDRFLVSPIKRIANEKRCRHPGKIRPTVNVKNV